MKGIPNVAVPKVAMNPAMSIYPNPFNSTTQINIDAAVALPCNIAVYDITGRMVMQKQQLTQRTLIINKDDIGSGIYFIKLIDNANISYCIKLIAE